LCIHFISIGLVYCPRRRKNATGTDTLGTTFGDVGGLYYGAREASFEAKASEDSLTGIGGRRGVFVAGGQCIRGS
jgi:hypothetical protein